MGELNLERVAARLVLASRAQGVSSPALASALAQARIEELAPDAELYVEGARSDALHVIVAGEVRVLVGPERAELVTLPAPTITGQLGLLAGLPRSATVVASGPVTVARLGDREMWALVRGDSAAGQALRRVLLASMAQLVGQTGARLEELVAAHGEPIPKDAPRIAPAKRSARKPRKAPARDSLTDAFSDSLVAQLDNLEVVRTAADERKRFKD